jgi:hypothetical protein
MMLAADYFRVYADDELLAETAVSMYPIAF